MDWLNKGSPQATGQQRQNQTKSRLRSMAARLSDAAQGLLSQSQEAEVELADEEGLKSLSSTGGCCCKAKKQRWRCRPRWTQGAQQHRGLLLQSQEAEVEM